MPPKSPKPLKSPPPPSPVPLPSYHPLYSQYLPIPSSITLQINALINGVETKVFRLETIGNMGQYLWMSVVDRDQRENANRDSNSNNINNTPVISNSPNNLNKQSNKSPNKPQPIPTSQPIIIPYNLQLHQHIHSLLDQYVHQPIYNEIRDGSLIFRPKMGYIQNNISAGDRLVVELRGVIRGNGVNNNGTNHKNHQNPIGGSLNHINRNDLRDINHEYQRQQASLNAQQSQQLSHLSTVQQLQNNNAHSYSNDPSNNLPHSYSQQIDQSPQSQSNPINDRYSSIRPIIFHPTHQQPTNLIHRLQSEKHSLLTERSKRAQLEHQRQVRSISEQIERAQQLKQIRHQEIRRRHLKRREKAEEEKQKTRAEEERFSEWLKDYRGKVPLHEKKESQWRQIEAQLRRQRLQKMEDVRSKYHSIDISRLDQHQRKYLQLKDELSEKKQIQMEMAQLQRAMRGKQMNEQFYRGKYRYLVLQEMLEHKQKLEVDPKQPARQRRDKLKAYGKIVNSGNKGNIGISKLLDQQDSFSYFRSSIRQGSALTPHSLQTLPQETASARIRQRQKRKLSEANPRLDGLNNLRQLRQYLDEQAKNGRIKPTVDLSPPPLTAKPNPIAQFRQQRLRNETDYHSGMGSRISFEQQGEDDPRRLLVQAREKDETNVWLEKKARNGALAHNGKELEEGYLAAIKAKIDLLRNCQ